MEHLFENLGQKVQVIENSVDQLVFVLLVMKSLLLNGEIIEFFLFVSDDGTFVRRFGR